MIVYHWKPEEGFPQIQVDNSPPTDVSRVIASRSGKGDHWDLWVVFPGGHSASHQAVKYVMGRPES